MTIFYVLPRSAAQYKHINGLESLPDGFEELIPSEDKHLNVEAALIALHEMSNVQTTDDIRLILEAGWCAADGLTFDQLKEGKVFLITNSVNVIDLLKDQTQREIIETAINLYGLEHLITVRHCNQKGEICDY